MMGTRAGQPPIAVTTRDYDRLIGLAAAALRRDPATAGFLAEELGRATLVEPRTIAADVVTMHSHVEFLHEPEQRPQCVTLVYPDEENIAEGRISVLTPLGAALIGLSEGQSIRWTARNGRRHRLTVLKVHFQLDAGGRVEAR